MISEINDKIKKDGLDKLKKGDYWLRILEVLRKIFGNINDKNKDIIKRIYLRRWADKTKRLRNREFAIYHWGWKYAKSPHLDIRINPNKLKNVPKSNLPKSNVNQENNNKPKETPKTKPKNKVETKVKGQVQGQDVTIQQSPGQKKNTKLINLNEVDHNKLKYQENQTYLKKGK